VASYIDQLFHKSLIPLGGVAGERDRSRILPSLESAGGVEGVTYISEKMKEKM